MRLRKQAQSAQCLKRPAFWLSFPTPESKTKMDNAIQRNHLAFIPFAMDNAIRAIASVPDPEGQVEGQSPPINGSRQPNSATCQWLTSAINLWLSFSLQGRSVTHSSPDAVAAIQLRIQPEFRPLQILPRYYAVLIHCQTNSNTFIGFCGFSSCCSIDIAVHGRIVSLTSVRQPTI